MLNVIREHRQRLIRMGGEDDLVELLFGVGGVDGYAIPSPAYGGDALRGTGTRRNHAHHRIDVAFSIDSTNQALMERAGREDTHRHVCLHRDQCQLIDRLLSLSLRHVLQLSRYFLNHEVFLKLLSAGLYHADEDLCWVHREYTWSQPDCFLKK